jgi:hypothetical protein
MFKIKDATSSTTLTKYCQTTRRHTQKTVLFVVTLMRTSNNTSFCYWSSFEKSETIHSHTCWIMMSLHSPPPPCAYILTTSVCTATPCWPELNFVSFSQTGSEALPTSGTLQNSLICTRNEPLLWQFLVRYFIHKHLNDYDDATVNVTLPLHRSRNIPSKKCLPCSGQVIATLPPMWRFWIWGFPSSTTISFSLVH